MWKSLPYNKGSINYSQLSPSLPSPPLPFPPPFTLSLRPIYTNWGHRFRNKDRTKFEFWHFLTMTTWSGNYLTFLNLREFFCFVLICKIKATVNTLNASKLLSRKGSMKRQLSLNYWVTSPYFRMHCSQERWPKCSPKLEFKATLQLAKKI